MHTRLSLSLTGGLLLAAAVPTSAFARGWRNEAYLRPSMGANVFTPEDGDPQTVMSLGGMGGIHYWEKGPRYPKMRGHARVAASYLTTGGPLSGLEGRIGNFMGPTWGTLGFTVGPDFFYNQFAYGNTVIPATGGMGVPFTVDANLEPFMLFAGIEPSWYFNDVRERRDWSTQDGLPGFGHEFAYVAGAAVAVGGWMVGGSIRHSMTAYGEQNSFGVTANFRGELGKKGKKGKKRR